MARTERWTDMVSWTQSFHTIMSTHLLFIEPLITYFSHPAPFINTLFTCHIIPMSCVGWLESCDA
jgi:hypothetical protein